MHKVLHLSELTSGSNLEEYLSVLVDETNHLEIEDVRNADFKTPRILKDHDYPDYLDHTFWMKFQVLNDLGRDTTFLVSGGRFKRCQLFQDNDNASDLKFGFAMSRNNWPSPISPDYYPVKFKNGIKSLIYLKGSVHVEGIQQKIRLDLKTEEQLALYFQQKLKESISVYRTHHLFFGILLCMMVFAILSLLLQKEKGYLYFLMIILFAVFYYLELIHRDPIYESFYGIYNHQGDFYNLIAYLGGLSMMLFIDATLSLKPVLPKLHKVLIGLAVFFLLLFMTHLLLVLLGVRPSVQIRFHILLRLITFIPFFGSFVYLAIKHRTQLSKIIIFGVICLGISDLAFNILMTQSESNDWVLFNHPQKLLQAGFLLQSFSFLVALVIKQRGLLVDKNKAQINLIDQLKENSELKEKYAHTLQSEVEEKSKELVLEKEKTIKSQYENELLKLESELLASQMNPHFIFNSLNSIKYYAQTKSTDETAQYITTFAKLMRMMLQNSNKRLISLTEEIEFLNKYLDIERKRSDNHFTYSMVCDSDIDTDHIKLPPMILQPHVENSIWHGIMHNDKEGHLKVIFKSKQKYLICRIVDNGIGLKASQKLNRSRASFKSKSFGTSITKDRLKAMSRLYQLDVSIELRENFDDQGKSLGTTAELKIPILESSDLLRMNSGK